MPTYCIPTLGSVPGSADTFDWWSVPPPPTTTIRFSPDNPDWLGAFSLSQGNGANRDYVFRALRGMIGPQDYLFLSFLIRTSNLDILGTNRVNFLLGNSPSYVAIQARLVNAANTVAGTENAMIFTYKVRPCTANGAGEILESNTASSNELDLEATGRMWVDVIAPGRNLATKWAFQLAIPLGINWTSKLLNLPVSGTFKFWYEINTSVGNSPAMPVLYQMVNVPPPAHTKTPPQLVPVTDNTDPNPMLHTAALLESQLLEMSTAGVGCTDAVRLTASNIGTRAVPGGAARPNAYTIKLDLGKPYPPNSAPYNTNHTPDVTNVEHQNQFFAIPTFPIAPALSVPQKEAVRATFSLANWGSQLSDPTASSWRPIPGGTDAPYVDANGDCRVIWPGPAEPTAPGSFITTLVRNINLFLNVSAGGGTPTTPAQNPHQCMLVELSSVDPTVVITTSSVYRNMNIANASTFRRLAEISVVGAKPISAQPRDIYLYVQKFNMPNIVKGRQDPPPGFIGGDNFSMASTAPPHSNEVEEIAAFVPTYTVHAYIDTGEKFKLEDGRKVPLLRPQTAFGYFVQHSGSLYGWETRLYGAEKLAEDFYVIRVPNNGSRYVETVIQARASANEKPLPPDEPPCDWLCRIWRAIKKLFGIG
jgi:hypothetical protein